MIQPHAVLQVSNGVLDLGVAAVIGLQLQGFPVPVGDEAVSCSRAKRASLGTGRGLTRRTMSRTGAASGSVRKGVQVVCATSAAPSIQYGIGLQSASGMASIRFRRLLCLADGDGEADIHPAADGDHGRVV